MLKILSLRQTTFMHQIYTYLKGFGQFVTQMMCVYSFSFPTLGTHWFTVDYAAELFPLKLSVWSLLIYDTYSIEGKNIVCAKVKVL